VRDVFTEKCFERKSVKVVYNPHSGKILMKTLKKRIVTGFFKNGAKT